MKLPKFLFLLVALAFAGLWITSEAKSVHTQRTTYNNEVHDITANLNKTLQTKRKFCINIESNGF